MNTRSQQAIGVSWAVFVSLVVHVSLFAVQPEVLPSAQFVLETPNKPSLKIELRCVKAASSDQPYFCEVARTLGRTQLAAQAIYPAQLQAMLSGLAVQQSDANGSFPTPAAKTQLQWNWSIWETQGAGHTDAQDVFPSQQTPVRRSAYWFFEALRSWSNFAG